MKYYKYRWEQGMYPEEDRKSLCVCNIKTINKMTIELSADDISKLLNGEDVNKNINSRDGEELDYEITIYNVDFDGE